MSDPVVLGNRMKCFVHVCLAEFNIKVVSDENVYTY